MTKDPMFYDELPEKDEYMDRAKEILNPELRNALRQAASMSALIAATEETPESLEQFLVKALTAIYNDGRNAAGKTGEPETPFDASDHTVALSVGVALFGLSPEDAFFGAFMAVFVEGYDSDA
jgi:hypothetical protein